MRDLMERILSQTFVLFRLGYIADVVAFLARSVDVYDSPLPLGEFSLELPLLPSFSAHNLYTQQLYKIIPRDLPADDVAQKAGQTQDIADALCGKKMKAKIKEVRLQ